MSHRADGLVFFILVSSIAIADVGYPTSRLLKLQSSEKPEMVHIRCEPIGDEKLRCNRIALSISTPTPLDDDALLERIEADIQMPGATDSLKELCPTLISELPKSKDEIREKALREAQECWAK